MTDSLPETVEAIAGGLDRTSARLTVSLGRRWVKGNGFCHHCVGTELIKLGVAESRTHRGVRQIRISPLGQQVQAFLGDPRK